MLSRAKTAERLHLYDNQRTIDRLFYVGNLLIPPFDFCLIVIETVGLQLLLCVHLATPAPPTDRAIWRHRSTGAQAAAMLACPTDGAGCSSTVQPTAIPCRCGVCLSKQSPANCAIQATDAKVDEQAHK